MKTYVRRMILALALVLSLSVGVASAATRPTPPPDPNLVECQEQGFTNYVIRGGDLICYSVRGR